MSDPDTEVTISLSAYQIASLEAFIANQEGNLTHAEAVLQILDDWFISLRYKRHSKRNFPISISNHPDGPNASHALTFKLGQSMGLINRINRVDELLPWNYLTGERPYCLRFLMLLDASANDKYF